MSVVIIGGHDRMHCQYKDICKKFGCKAKVFTQNTCNLDRLIGNPDLIVLCTNPVSHGMANIARKEAANRGITLVQSHSGSRNALKNILETSLG
ncbi:MAG: DUF2325 domain-containing protein [Spirochaetaceae bacterium]|jgi:hypothetical protein|nr:DUF2325 domain-containing protein [Spirochaetaceae bacterium]